MSLNPFVALGTDPVGTLAVLGYALMLLSLAWLAVIGVWRWTLDLYVALVQQSGWDVPAPSGEAGARGWRYVPPSGFILKAAAIPFVLAWAVWAVGGVIYFAVP